MQYCVYDLLNSAILIFRIIILNIILVFIINIFLINTNTPLYILQYTLLHVYCSCIINYYVNIFTLAVFKCFLSFIVTKINNDKIRILFLFLIGARPNS